MGLFDLVRYNIIDKKTMDNSNLMYLAAEVVRISIIT